MTALYTRAFAAEGAGVYAPLSELLRHPRIQRILPSLDTVWLAELARLLPELTIEHSELAPPQPIREGWQRRRFHEAVAQTVLRSGDPLLHHFDDLQWCDTETLDWVRLLLRISPRQKLLLLGTVRVEEVDEDHPLLALQRELQQDGRCHLIDLDALAADDTSRLAEEVLGRAIPTAEALDFYQQTEGSPLFIVELGRTKLVAGEGSTEPEMGREPEKADAEASQTLPPRVQAVIEGRLSQLSPEARELAEVAAVIGRRFTFTLLETIGRFDTGALVSHLDELWRRRIVREQGKDEYDFSHDRIREVAYLRISPMRLRFLHQQAAVALLQLHTSRLDSVSSLVAEHYVAAGLVVEAVDYFLRAGRHADKQYARQNALHFFERAAEFAQPEDFQRRFAIHLDMEQLHFALRNLDESETQLKQLDLLLDEWETADPVRSPKSKERASVQIRWHALRQGHGDMDAAEAHALDAIRLAQIAGDVRLEAEARIAAGTTAWNVAHFDKARDRFEAALETGRAAGSTGLVGTAHELIAQTGMFSGLSSEEIMRHNLNALKSYEAVGDVAGRASMLNKLGYLPMANGTGRYEQAVRDYRAGLALAQQVQEFYLEGTILRNLGLMFAIMGRYSESFEHLDRSISLSRWGNMTFLLGIAYNYQGFISFQMGDYREALSAHDRFFDVIHHRDSQHFIAKSLTNLSQIHLAQNQLESALEFARRARRLAAECSERRQESFASTILGNALLQCAEIEEARDAYLFALSELRAMGLANRALEPLAGLARIECETDPVAALQIVNEIMSHLEDHPLDRTDEALHVYLTCYRVLQENGDPRGFQILARAGVELNERAASLKTDNQRTTFWAAPLHREVAQILSIVEPPSDASS